MNQNPDRHQGGEGKPGEKAEDRNTQKRDRNDTGQTNPAAGSRTDVPPPGKIPIGNTGTGGSSGV